MVTWQAFAGIHAEAASSGHWGNVSLTKYYKGTYLDGSLPKIHKTGTPLRPIVPVGVQSPMG